MYQIYDKDVAISNPMLMKNVQRNQYHVFKSRLGKINLRYNDIIVSNTSIPADVRKFRAIIYGKLWRNISLEYLCDANYSWYFCSNASY